MQEYVQRKRLAQKTEGTEENKQEYAEMQCKVKVEVAKAKQMGSTDFYLRLHSKQEETDFYKLVR